MSFFPCILLTISSLLFISCDYAELEPDGSIKSPKTCAMHIPAGGSSGILQLPARGISVSSCPDWINVSVNGQKLHVNVMANRSREARNGIIKLSTSKGKKMLAMHQEPIAPPILNAVNYGNGLPATDAHGRSLPSAAEAGPGKNRYVGMFYWIWHTWHSNKPAFVPSEIIAAHPEAEFDFNNPAWSVGTSTFWWGEPLFGFYRDTDEWVLLRHAQMLSDAGVDVIIFDATNATLTWDDSWPTLCRVYTEARERGVKTPQIAFLLPFSASHDSFISLQNIYKNLYKPGIYSDLFFMWDGKPLIMAYPAVLDKFPGEGDPELLEEIRNYFTFRPGQPSYNKGEKKKGQWGWLEIYPQHGFGNVDGRPEEMTVGVAQNWADGKLSAMNAPGAFGRSYTNAAGHSTEPEDSWKGLNFQEQWDYAISQDPQFIFITGWNEWIMGRYDVWREQANAFPDEYDQEHSRDIEPMKGGHGDSFYYQLTANIRRFKGMPVTTVPCTSTEICIDGNFSDWWSVPTEYRDPSGDTIHRNHDGWAGLHYSDDSGRNDITIARVADDAENIYFYVSCADEITSENDPAWMRLYIDADNDWKTGWNGYDFILNRIQPQDGKAALEKGGPSWEWDIVTWVDFNCSGHELEIAIPKKHLGLSGNHFSLAFKWADNIQNDGDMDDFMISGDSAPMGRYNWSYAR